MKVYVYRTRLHCERCSRAISRRLLDSGIRKNHDSDIFPQGPFSDGGGKADAPQHCDICHVFLENPLTSIGVDYVLDRVSCRTIPAEWRTFYDYLFATNLHFGPVL
jgi:hypothetical protein